MRCCNAVFWLRSSDSKLFVEMSSSTSAVFLLRSIVVSLFEEQSRCVSDLKYSIPRMEVSMSSSDVGEISSMVRAAILSMSSLVMFPASEIISWTCS